MIRLFDFSFSFFGLIFLSPIIILIWVIGLFENGSPLFIQKRIGCSKKLFLLIKFRTMKKETISKATHLVKDSMITKFGNFLRVTKLDEVLQLFNVLVGDMSLIGPRPLTQETFSMYSTKGQLLIYKCRPGLSGLGSIVFRNEEDLYPSGVDKVEFYKTKIAPLKENLEIWYNKNMSYGLYLELIMMTIIAIAFGNSQFVQNYSSRKIQRSLMK